MDEDELELTEDEIGLLELYSKHIPRVSIACGTYLEELMYRLHMRLPLEGGHPDFEEMASSLGKLILAALQGNAERFVLRHVEQWRECEENKEP